MSLRERQILKQKWKIELLLYLIKKYLYLLLQVVQELCIWLFNKIEEKDYNGIKCKYYYCTTKDEDIINGYQKAIVIKEFDTVYLGLFATEIDLYRYQFSISNINYFHLEQIFCTWQSYSINHFLNWLRDY